MYKHILIPTDGSELSNRTLRQGIDFAKENGAEVTLLTCSLPLRALGPQVHLDPDEYAKSTAQVARERFQDAADYAKSQGVKASLRHVYDERPADVIVDTARREACDLVFMASHGRRGLEALVLGSETRKVLSESKLPVLVCR